jgi:hypothetical protein
VVENVTKVTIETKVTMKSDVNMENIATNAR